MSKKKNAWCGCLLALLLGGCSQVERAQMNSSANTTQGHELLDASRKGHASVVELLLASGTDPNLQDKYGDTALMIASIQGHVEVLKLLLAVEADPNLQDNMGWTALIRASAVGHVEAVKLLLAVGADLNLQSKKGKTALMFAAYEGSIAEGSARKRDIGFALGGAGLSAGFGGVAGGAYTNTDIGKIVSAAFLDAYNKLVASTPGGQ